MGKVCETICLKGRGDTLMHILAEPDQIRNLVRLRYSN